MISYLKGRLEEVGEDYILVDVNNIGYQVNVSLRVMEGLPCIGEEIKIHTYTYVREDVIALYGFVCKEDLTMFLLLLGMNGIGPKGALNLLSIFSSYELKIAIASQDAKSISKAPGIGLKTAQKMIIELQDKISLEQDLNKITEAYPEKTNLIRIEKIKSEVIQALLVLGYSQTESMRALKYVKITENINSEDLLKEVLKHLF